MDRPQIGRVCMEGPLMDRPFMLSFVGVEVPRLGKGALSAWIDERP